eukprot:TRINITY_DN2753_c0_g1_i5.p2 TRINITY_DN2753_c0_g1~~TRINITY_DN2753_c0_g1_i5.p2  ORF type:complete len:435 (-),score=37.07 TRINITY_DN2753_c0_g1_i5:498-1802(-)
MRNVQVRAFTLIEVLIAVLVLSLGVLGLGAIFSVGIPQQRIASDQIQAINVAASAKAALLGNAKLNDRRNVLVPDDIQLKGWYGLQQRVADDPAEVFRVDRTWSPMGEWILPVRDLTDNDLDERWIAMDPIADNGDRDVGEIVIVATDDDLQGDEKSYVRLGVEQRLSPAPYTQNAEPKYVWDFIARRVPSGNRDIVSNLVEPTQQDQIEIAVFVRKVDPGIQVQARRRGDDDDRLRFGNRLRLGDYLTMNAEQITGDVAGQINASLRVVPVSADIDSSQPRRDGRTFSAGNEVGEYAMVYGVGVADVATYPGGSGGLGGGAFQEIPRDRLPLEAWGVDPENDENRLRLATQTGHRLLDRFGTVYEILGIDEELTEQLGTPVVRIDPPAPRHFETPADFRYPPNPDSPNDLLRTRAFLTTPQTPLAIEVFRVTP